MTEFNSKQLVAIEDTVNGDTLECPHCGSAMTQNKYSIDEFHCNNFLYCDYKFYIDEDGDRQPF